MATPRKRPDQTPGEDFREATVEEDAEEFAPPPASFTAKPPVAVERAKPIEPPEKPEIADRDVFKAAVWQSSPGDFGQCIEDEIFRERAKADGVTPEWLMQLRGDLWGYCARVTAFRGSSGG